MHTSLKSWMTLPIAGLFFVGGLAVAQEEDRVEVDLSNVQDEIAQQLDIDAQEVPSTIEAPVGIAQQACPEGAPELAQQLEETGFAECTADNAPRALINQVQQDVADVGMPEDEADVGLPEEEADVGMPEEEAAVGAPEEDTEVVEDGVLIEPEGDVEVIVESPEDIEETDEG